MNQFELNSMFSYILGKGIGHARQMIPSMYIRAIRKDGQDIVVDGTYKENRLNVEMENTKIVRILSIG